MPPRSSSAVTSLSPCATFQISRPSSAATTATATACAPRRSRPLIEDVDRRPDVDLIEQPLDLGDPHADAPVRDRVADRGRVGRAVDADSRRGDTHPARPEWIPRARRDRLRVLGPVGCGRIPPRVPPLDDDLVAPEGRRIPGFPGRDAERAPVLHPVVEEEPVQAAADHDHVAERGARRRRPDDLRPQHDRCADMRLQAPEEVANHKQLPHPLPGLVLGHERLRVAQQELGVDRLAVEPLRELAHVPLEVPLGRRRPSKERCRPGKQSARGESPRRRWRRRPAASGSRAASRCRPSTSAAARRTPSRRRSPGRGQAPTSTSPPTVTPAAIVVGRGTVGVVVVGVVVGGRGRRRRARRRARCRRPVPVSAVADGVAASSTAESTPAAAHTTSRENASPRRLTSPV